MRQAPSAVSAALNAAPVATFVMFFSEGISKGVVCLRFGARVPARTSTSESGYTPSSIHKYMDNVAWGA